MAVRPFAGRHCRRDLVLITSTAVSALRTDDPLKKVATFENIMSLCGKSW